MIMRLVITKNECDFFRGVKKLTIPEDALSGTHGKIMDGKKILTVVKFRCVRARYGGILITPDKGKTCLALGVSIDEPGIIEGLLPAEYAKKHGVCRQHVNKQINTGKIKAERVGSLWVIRNQK